MPRYRLDASIVLKDLYRLLSAIMSIHSVEKLNGGKDDPLLELQGRFAESEIVHLLVTTAAAQRVHEDSVRPFRDDHNDSFGKDSDRVCGQLTIEGETKPLLIRDACNKIIHASSIEILDAAKPFLALQGRQGKKAWEANVELIEYIRASVENLEDAI